MIRTLSLFNPIHARHADYRLFSIQYFCIFLQSPHAGNMNIITPTYHVSTLSPIRAKFTKRCIQVTHRRYDWNTLATMVCTPCIRSRYPILGCSLVDSCSIVTSLQAYAVKFPSTGIPCRRLSRNDRCANYFTFKISLIPFSEASLGEY